MRTSTPSAELPVAELVSHKGYQGEITPDEDAGVFFGRVLGIADVVTFEGDSMEEARIAFIESVEDYLALRQCCGEPPDPPS